MNRHHVLALFASVCGLALASEPAAAQHPYYIARGQVEAAAMGTYLSPTAAYPIGPMYYPTAVPSDPTAGVYWRLVSAEQVTPNVATPAQAQTPVQTRTPAQVPSAEPDYSSYYSGYYYCQCDRCRRARGECPRRNGGLIDDLWELERRKNAFLYRVFFGD